MTDTAAMDNKANIDITNTNLPAEPPKTLQLNNNKNLNHNIDVEEKEGSNDLELSYCRGLSKTPLAVPMVAATLDKSVTRNDAKAITSTRLKRLKELSQRAEDSLTKDQKHEKKRIIRLEKNRRAAAMSRRKKKMYVKGLEDKVALMARHLAILEMENAQLRGLLNASHPHPMMGYKVPNMPQYQMAPSATPHFVGSSNNSETTNSMEPNTESISSAEPSFKRRKLNDGTSSNTTIASCDAASDISLEPLPIDDNKSMILPPLPTGFMPATPAQNHLLPPSMQNMHGARGAIPYHANMASNAFPDDKVDVISNENNDELPPTIEYLSILDDGDIIDERVDECGSVDVVAFPPDMNDNKQIYL